MGTLQLTQYPMPLQAPAAQSAPFQFSPSAPPNDGEECPVGIEQLWAAHARNVYCSESKKSGMRDDLCKFFFFFALLHLPRDHLPAICPPSARGAATERRLALGPHATEGQWRHPAALGGLLLLGAARRSSAPRPIQRAPRCNGRGIVVLVLAQAPVSACLRDESAKTVEVWIANGPWVQG